MKKEKINIDYNKILKLSNVVMKDVDFKNINNIEREVVQMENYLKRKGAQPIGPIIQYMSFERNEQDEIVPCLKILRQSDSFLHNVEQPYKMNSLYRKKNCMYARYIGEEEKIKFAYDKINVIAFEEDIPLKGDSYTVFVDRDDNKIIADIFMERADS